MKALNIGLGIFFLTCSAWAGTFMETFDNEALEDWRELNVHDAFPGTWEILDGELQGTTHGGAARFLTTSDETWQNYSIQVDVKPLKKHGPGKIGIAARVKGTWVFWCRITDLHLNAPKSDVVCGSRDVDTPTGILFHIAPHRLLKLNKWSTLKLSVNEDHFIFSINEKKNCGNGRPFCFSA